MNADAYPLYWPTGWIPTPPNKRQKSRYQVSFARARDELLKELRLLGARDVIISTNVALRRDGLPYANTGEPEHPGVAVYWEQKKQARVIACDAWIKVAENLRAVGLTVASLRQIERTGASEILDRAFTGFNALPQASDDDPLWFFWELGFQKGDQIDEGTINEAYRKLAKQRHPDNGGSHEAMHRLNNAKALAIKTAVRS